MGFVPFAEFMVRAMSRELALMLERFENVGYAADIAGLRRELPGVRNFASFLREARNGR